jgi:hemerythrin-like domain-containing protein
MMVAHQDDPEPRCEVTSLDDDDPRVVIDRVRDDLVSSPLDFIYAEHLRQRQFAKLVHLVADGVINRRTIVGAIKFLDVDFRCHVQDEEKAFFPLLRPLCDEDDNVDGLLTLLTEEHREDAQISRKITKILRRLSEGGEPSKRDSDELRNFADRLKQHLALENGVLLPLARMRMTPEALALLSHSIASHRQGLRS